MRRRVVLALLLGLVWCTTAAAQQAQPITFVSDYWVRPGKEEEFLNVVNTVGGPVRDKLMAEGVVWAWGVDVPVLRMPGQPTHSIWYDVGGWDGVEKVRAGIQARVSEINEQDKKAADEAKKKGQKAPKSFTERWEEIIDTGKIRDWVFRNLYAKGTSATPPAGALPYSRVFLVTVKPGKAAEWRATFDKYIKPTLDSLVDNGTINAWGLGVEEVRTDGAFTHFVWVSYPNMAAMEKQRNVFVELNNKRSPEESAHINWLFTETSDAATARSFVLRALIFKVAPQK